MAAAIIVLILATLYRVVQSGISIEEGQGPTSDLIRETCVGIAKVSSVVMHILVISFAVYMTYIIASI